ncbi:hypothetical protein [Pseudonocardia abyssalis]|uniref:Nucleotide exchange factor GrpE n=1 Tax=Pseudonocardia abyssalis TaxID=2792008 RepID=A0ABS6UQ99_9PSEU|nr:hypothetical protein [Pseudonocardia abyssalis]MBW0116305.1 nucleotide exchange factor GrpE [Pseudonocardia abyssalis]MBW0134436.1 nucleotide exchange factor GrpE [Pseudonocardia abyssalis]
MRELADKIDDIARLLTRQSAAIAALADAPAATGPDVPLLVDLHALHRDTLACAATARSRRERDAFTAVAAGLERLVVGRGGTLVVPAPGDAFRGTQMEAAELVPTDDPAQDRTVARLLEPGLDAAGRSVRPARVAVFRTR